MTLPPVVSTPIRSLAATLAWLCVLLCSARPALAAEGDAKEFDVPAGDAAATLKLFSDQAGQQVVYMVDTVRAERTNAVKGRLPAHAALEQMLAGTRLIAVQDAATAALSVRRQSARTPGGAALPALSSARMPARTDDEPIAARAAKNTALDDTVRLSPFAISSSRDQGFAAASGVAGGRLAIDLRDSPASYSVLNNEFLDTLQITSLEQAADWAPNSTRVPDQGNESTFGGAVLVATRGVAGVFAQRDFFPMEFDFDSYNLDRFDYGRGPNAVLFGFAAFSGTQNVVPKQARLDRDFGEVRVAFGSWDNRRSTLDANYRLGDTAALRVNLLAQERHGWRELEHESKQALHLAGTWQVAERTQLRGELEAGRFSANLPYPSGYRDGILGWNGAYVYNARQDTPAAAAALGVVSYGGLASNVNAFVFSPSQNAANVIDVMGTGRTTTAQNGGLIGGRPVLGSANSFAGVTVSELLNSPSGRYDLAIANSKFSLPPGSHSFGLTDSDFGGRTYRIASIFLTHRRGDLFLEAAANYSSNERWAIMTAQNGQTAYIDVNRTLPGGQPNPMFLQPYTQGQLRRIADWWRKRNLRLSAAYFLENTRLGSYTFQGMGGAYYSDRPYLYQMFGVQRFTDQADRAQKSELVEYRQYWQVSRTLKLPATATYVDANGASRTIPVGWMTDARNRGTQFKDGRETEFAQASIRGRWFDDRLIGIVSGRADDLRRRTWRSAPSRDLVGTNWNGTDRVWQPLTDVNTWTSLTYAPKDANGNPTGPAQPAITRPRDSLGVSLPQYTRDRFQDDYSGFPIHARVTSLFAGAVFHLHPWASLAFNYSEGADFNDAPNRWDGSVFPQKTSRGIDVGLRSSFLDGRILSSLTYYQGREGNEGFSSDPGVPWTSFNTIINANQLGDLSENGINARGFPVLTAAQWDSRTTENRGLELEVVANVTPSWRLMLNAARPQALQTENAPDFRAYFKTNEAALRGILADAGVVIGPLGQASLNPAVPASLRAPNDEQQNAANAWNTIYPAYQNLLTGAQDLKRLPTFTANLLTDYSFSSGRLKGWKVGGGLNCRGRQVVGYRGSDTIADPANPTQAIDDPRAGPGDSVYSSSYSMAVLELGYTWRYKQGRSFRVDLKIDNLFDCEKPIYIATAMLPPRGNLATPARVATPALYWRMPPRNYLLSVTNKF